MKQTLKTAAAVAGMIGAGVLLWYAIIEFMWACYYAGFTM